MTFTTFLGAMELGMIFAILSLGVFISLRILNTPDLTIDGSFVLGMAISVQYAFNGRPILGLLMAMVFGAMAGIVTGFLQTTLNMSPILAGILTMTGLYSINLKAMGNKPNIALFGKETIFSYFKNIVDGDYSNIILITIIGLVIFLLLFVFLKTQMGLCLIATGDNEDMVRASSINSEFMKVQGFALSNLIVALSGGIYGQYQEFADVTGGIGMMVIGVASIIVGETIIKSDKLIIKLIAVFFGAIVYRLLLTVAMDRGVNPSDLKLLSALLVVAVISLPVLKDKIKDLIRRRKNVKIK